MSRSVGQAHPGRTLSHTFDRLAAAITSQAEIKANGYVCRAGITPLIARTRGWDKAPLLATDGASLTFGGAVRAHAASLSGVGDYYRVRFERELLTHFAEVLARPIVSVTAVNVRLWIRGCEEVTNPWLLRNVAGTSNE